MLLDLDTTVYKISELEDMWIEIIWTETQRKKQNYIYQEMVNIWLYVYFYF